METNNYLHKPPPMSLDHHYNKATLDRLPNSLKGLYQYFLWPGMANLAGGLPNPSYFPYHLLTAKHAPSSTSRTLLTIPPLAPQTHIDLNTCLQYGRAPGLAALGEFVQRFSEIYTPEVPYAGGIHTLLSCGATDGFSKACALFAEDGDSMLVEEVTYPNAVTTARAYGVKPAPVKMDDEGFDPEDLERVLATWHHEHPGQRRPHLLYTVPTGQNPSGRTAPIERRKAVYEVCCRWDVVIIEDDPYFHLQYHDTPAGGFLKGLVPSYLSIDKEGRVMRLDTFSKTIAPGCRLGWITAQKDVIERLILVTETSTQQPSGISQALVAGLVCGEWGMDGWLSWLEQLRNSYWKRMRAMSNILAEYANYIPETDTSGWTLICEPRKMYTFSPAAAGMFIWVELLPENHPHAKELLKQLKPREIAMKIWKYITETKLVMVAPGGIFETVDGDEKSGTGMRLCFSAVDVEEVEGKTRGWCEGLEGFWGLSVQEILDIDGIDVGKLEAEKETVGLVGMGC